MYTKGATFTELNQVKVYGNFDGKRACAGCAKIADGKWLPLILICNLSKQGHFRSFVKAFIADTKTHRTIKAALTVARQAD